MGIYTQFEARYHTNRANRKRERLAEDLADAATGVYPICMKQWTIQKEQTEKERPVKDLDDAAMGVYPIWTKEGTIQREKTEKETDLLRILPMQPWEYTQFG